MNETNVVAAHIVIDRITVKQCAGERRVDIAKHQVTLWRRQQGDYFSGETGSGTRQSYSAQRFDLIQRSYSNESNVTYAWCSLEVNRNVDTAIRTTRQALLDSAATSHVMDTMKISSTTETSENYTSFRVLELERF